MLTLYGIPNCDQARQARRWLEAHGIDYRFRDLRADGLDAHRLQVWATDLGWEALLNRRSTTWRSLDATEREGLDQRRALALMLAHPSLIKRPLLDLGRRRQLGFSDADYRRLLGAFAAVTDR